MQARGFFERALALDPGNLDALVRTALIGASSVGLYYTTDDRRERLEAAEATITKALSLAPEDAFAHYVLGMVQVLTNRSANGVAEFERALSLDPNLAVAHGLIGLAKSYLGRASDAEGHVRQALRLSPLDTRVDDWCRFVGLAKLLTGADEESVAWSRRSIEASRSVPVNHFLLAAALAHLDRTEEARAAARAGLALDPNFSISRARTTVFSDNPTFLAQRERVIGGFRKAGIPEG